MSSTIERDPNKRKVKPVEQACVLDFDEESSDDSDFRIEDHREGSDDDDDDEDDDDSNSESDENDESSEAEDDVESDLNLLKSLSLPSSNGISSISDVISQANIQSKLKQFDDKDAQILICCGCLGDQSDGVNELVECDGCGVTVHEACYGIADSASLASTDSVSPTTPWFCETCKAGVKDPICELCPNKGGIFKETDVGKWVHLVCALYVPGVAFGEVDKLTSVTLFEMPYSKWGAKSCSLCENEKYSRTGVCIGCDAGMCRTYFHVTCAQREGLLSEAHSEEVDQADPFYAHCKLHSDKTLVRRRRRNYLALQLRMHYRKLQFEQEGHKDTPEQIRIQRKMEKQKVHYLSHKASKPAPWVPTQKMPRLLTTSASAVNKLLRKAELMGINTSVMETQESHSLALADVRKKWHIPPAFSVEFIAYFLDRNDRLKEMKTSLEKLMVENKKLLEEQQSLRATYDNILKKSTKVNETHSDLKQTIQKYHSAILSACPTKNLPNVDELGKPPVNRAPQPMMVPTAAALKMGVGFPLKNIPTSRGERVLNLSKDPLTLNECGICRQRRDQHLLAKCDTCHLYYHLNCLNPPLSRLPKKSKLYGWQCSECDKTSDSEIEEMKTPRRSRSKYKSYPDFAIESPPEIKDKTSDDSKDITYKHEADKANTGKDVELHELNGIPMVLDNGLGESHKSAKKRRREKHRSRYSPDLGSSSKEHKRKRKKKSFELDESLPLPRITIKIKSIPLPEGEVASESNPQCFYVPNETSDAPPQTTIIVARRDKRKSKSPRLSDAVDPDEKPTPVAPTVPADPPAPVTKKTDIKELSTNNTICDVCQEECVSVSSVKCDDCQKSYHFTCLEPPLKKSPKRRGYSWHCSDCDPTL